MVVTDRFHCIDYIGYVYPCHLWGKIWTACAISVLRSRKNYKYIFVLSNLFKTMQLVKTKNSLWWSDAMCCWKPWSSLVHVMACHLFGAKPLPHLDQCLFIVNYHPKALNKFSEILLKNNHFCPENSLENVICIMVALFSRPQKVNL